MRQIVTPALAASVLGVASALAGHVALAQAPAGRACPSATGHEVVLTAPLPGGMKTRSMIVAGGKVWIAVGSRRTGGRGRLFQVDPLSGRVRRAFTLVGDPWSLAYGFGSLWLTGQGGGFDAAVVRIDPRTGRVTNVIRGPRRFGSAMAITSDGVWVGGGDIVPQRHPEETLARWVFKIDPRRDAVTRSVRLDATTVIALAGQGHAFWATGWGGVVKLSTTGRVLFQQRMDGAGWWIAPAPGGPWVARPFFGTRSSRQAFLARQLLRVRTSERRPNIVELAGQPGDLALAAGAAWTVVGDWKTGARELVRVDASGSVSSVATRGLPGLLASSPDALWVASQNPNTLSKVC